MRFSLLTLILFACTLGALIGVYVRWDPWVFSFSAHFESLRPIVSDHILNSGDSLISPDGGRRICDITASGEEPGIFIRDVHAEYQPRIYKLKTPTENGFALPNFNDNDTLFMYEDATELEYVYKRRHPEWWWGHFYRPEVWLAIIFSSLWLWRIVRWFRGASTWAGGRDQVAAAGGTVDAP